MSLTLTNDIFSGVFQQALAMLDDHDGFTDQIRWEISCFIDEFDNKYKVWEKERIKVMEKHCVKDSKKKPVFKKEDVIGRDGKVQLDAAKKKVTQEVYDFSPDDLEKKDKEMESKTKCSVKFPADKILVKFSENKMPKMRLIRICKGLFDIRTKE